MVAGGLVLLLAAGALLGPAGKARAQALPMVPVHQESRDGFNRILFDWQSPVGLQVSQDGVLATLRFDRPGRIDLAAVRRALPAPVTGIFSDAEATGLMVTLDLLPGYRLRHFRTGNAVVVDIVVASEDDTAAASVQVQQAEPVPVEQQPLPEQVPPEQASREQPPADPSRDVGRSADEPPGQQAGPGEGAVVVSAADGATAGQTATDPATLPTLVVSVVPSGNGLTLTFPFERIAAAAAFRRADTLWLVFDQPTQLDLGEAMALRPDLLQGGGQDFSAPATVLRLDQRGDRAMTPTLARSGLDWVVDLQPGVRRDPATALEVILETRADGARVFLPTGEVEPSQASAFQLRDPVVGDTLLVMPLRFAGFGVRGGRGFAQFSLLPSLQGVVVKPWADAVQVRGAPNGIAVDVATGLLLAARERPGAAEEAGREGLLHPLVWRHAAEAPFPEILQRLLYDFSVADEAQRLERQRDLIRFMFSYDFSADALGLLAVYADMQGGVTDLDPELRAIRGVSRLRMNRLEEAAADLDSPVFDAYADIALWRVPLGVAQGNNDRALDQYRRGLSALERYPPEMRSRFRLAAARAMVGVGAHRDALLELAAMKQEDAPSLSQRAWGHLLSAQAHAALDDLSAASTDFEAAINSGVMEVRVKSLYAQAIIDFENGDITRAQLVDQLDNLRYAWRGGAFEYDLLRKLGELYLAEGQYRAGLITLRQTAVYFPQRAAASAEIAGEMTLAFRKLFLDGEADLLEPLTALALYYDFRELTPTGQDGDEMIRKLADRLVGVDLLSQAAELMEHQINFRLDGEERARVGARLAVIDLLNRQPERALKALDDSATGNLAEQLEIERLQLRARALADLGRYAEALDPISGLDDPRSVSLRAEINWRAKNWKATAATLAPLADDLSRTEGPLAPEDRRRILQLAISLALEGENLRIEPLRDRFLGRLEGTPEAGAFGIITDSLQRDAGNIRQLTAAIAEVDRLEAFMADYRERLARGGLQAIN